jgi:monovalent cation:H+ antiporter-2, CPA2 family
MRSRLTGRAKGCEECLKMGDSWVQLRLCRTCGHVGCCDATRHPIITTLEPGETWSWCYVDQVALELTV